MTSPVVENILTQVFSTPGTTHNVTQQSPINADDLVIAVFAADGTGNTITWDNSPDTWTNLVANDGFGSQNWSIWYRFCDGTEDGETLAIGLAASQDAVSALIRISGADTGTPPEVATGADTTSATADSPLISPSWGAADSLAVAVVCSASSIMTAPTYPSGYTNTGFVDGGAAGTVFIGYATKDFTTSSENPGAFTLTASQSHVAYTIAVKGVAASSTLTDVDTDENVTPSQANVVGTGTGLSGCDGFRIKTGTKTSAFSFDSATSTTIQGDVPSMATLVAAGIRLGVACTFEAMTSTTVSASLAGTTSLESGWTTHTVADTTDIAVPECLYSAYATAIDDDFYYKTTTELYGWPVTIDSLGYPIIDRGGDNRTDTFLYYWHDTSAETGTAVQTAEVSTIPTLSGLTFGAGGISVDTDNPEGTIWAVVTTSATTPSHAQIKAGQTHTGAAAAWAGSDATPTSTTVLTPTGLTNGVTYYAHVTQENDADTPDAATPISSSSFTPGSVSSGVRSVHRMNISISLSI